MISSVSLAFLFAPPPALRFLPSAERVLTTEAGPEPMESFSDVVCRDGTVSQDEARPHQDILAEARAAFESSLGPHGAGKIVLRVAE